MTAADQLRAMIARTPGAVDVLFGSLATPGILDFDGTAWGPEGEAQLGVEVITLTYVYPDLPGLVPGSAITAGGTSYTVARGPRRRGDGLEAVVILEESA